MQVGEFFFFLVFIVFLCFVIKFVFYFATFHLFRKTSRRRSAVDHTLTIVANHHMHSSRVTTAALLSVHMANHVYSISLYLISSDKNKFAPEQVIKDIVYHLQVSCTDYSNLNIAKVSAFQSVIPS